MSEIWTQDVNSTGSISSTVLSLKHVSVLCPTAGLFPSEPELHHVPLDSISAREKVIVEKCMSFSVASTQHYSGTKVVMGRILPPAAWRENLNPSLDSGVASPNSPGHCSKKSFSWAPSRLSKPLLTCVVVPGPTRNPVLWAYQDVESRGHSKKDLLAGD